jgi:opine dehydrogenase
VWETVLINFNAIDHVATMVANAGTAENRTGGMLLWGEGATPSVVRVIEAVDGELLAIRRALGLSDERRYRDFLIAQGFAPDAGPGLYEVMRASKLVLGYAPTGADGLRTRYITEDVPYALVLAASIGDEVGVETPVVDGLIAITSVMLGQDFRADGRTLNALGLAGSGADGLRRFAETGEVPLRGTDGTVRADSTA